MRENLLGIDIGGTKCAVIYGRKEGATLEVVDKVKFATSTPKTTLEEIFTAVEELMTKHKLTAQNTAAIGVSCGGPLNSQTGTILSPPNLPGWDEVPIVKMLTDRFGLRAGIQNDANACALAEWTFGAGVGTRNLIFMTFGTGLGAGLILNGQLYAGTNDNAGEVGHLRLAEFGPIGYGKAGSFEGFCSGGGIAQLARMVVSERLQMGEHPALCESADKLDTLTAALVAQAAREGDALASEVFRLSGTYLGRGLSLLIDLLNPEVIVIGSIYERAEELLAPHAQAVIQREALPLARAVCQVKPALLGDRIGDYAALSVAANLL